MPGQNTIRISPSGLGLPDKEYYYRDLDDPVQTAYREYIRDIVIYLGSPRNEATKFGTDMFFYEKRIAEITPDRISLRNPITTYNAISLQELKQTNPIQFFDILQAMYPESNITVNTEVIVTSMEYLGQISQIIATTDRKTMNGYLMWTLVREYIPYLSTSYTSALDTFNSALYGTQEPLERWEMCARLVRKFMGLATSNRQELLNPITNFTTEIIGDEFNSILNIVKSKIIKYQNSELLYNHLKSKKKLEEKMLNKASEEDTILSYALAEVPKVEYSPSDNAVIIPRSLLVEPFFDEKYPRLVANIFVNYR
ncbi:unnamed protein product [Phaedon cochleariae]|uniref:Peptidase M13 N-terminal domain-containing protein n=1 Tax=Phaedon cochleariae TaxID=80249 RepID=A0A9N9SH35_PHACE|nr:unnamed protein product [Phaedon cochleariae]